MGRSQCPKKKKGFFSQSRGCNSKVNSPNGPGLKPPRLDAFLHYVQNSERQNNNEGARFVTSFKS